MFFNVEGGGGGSGMKFLNFGHFFVRIKNDKLRVVKKLCKWKGGKEEKFGGSVQLFLAPNENS
jgi:hypothetical protein